MRVATWNINGLRARLDFVLHWLRSRQPDIVGFQELKVDEEKFPAEVFAAEGYSTVIHSQKSWNGVAILSRKKAEIRKRGIPGEEEMGARLVSARIEDLHFTTVYCPNGKSVEHADFPRKLRWFESLAGLLESEFDPSEPGILCGDFNVCPAPIDSWNEGLLGGRIFHTKEERSRFQQLLDWGLTDAFRQLEPDRQAFSWWDYRAGAFHRNQGLRIDFLLVTEPTMLRLKSVEIDREYRKKKDGLIASDHAPVIANLE